MSEPTGSEAHPAFNRVMDSSDLLWAPVGFRVVDSFAVVWTKQPHPAEGQAAAFGRWTSNVEESPGMDGTGLIRLCGPVRRYQP